MAWILKGNIKGSPGIGVRGTPGLSGINGKNGIHGQDAPLVTNIELDGDKDSFSLIFEFSDGSFIETNELDFPKLKEEINNYFMSASSSSGAAVDQATKLVLEKTASETINIGELVRLDSSTTSSKATIDTYENSKVVGIALDDVLIGETLRILVSGIHEDAGYGFAVNQPLFLQSDSSIGINAPTTTGEFVVRIGESLGTGAIFLRVDEPMEIV